MSSEFVYESTSNIQALHFIIVSHFILDIQTIQKTSGEGQKHDRETNNKANLHINHRRKDMHFDHRCKLTTD